LNSVTLPHKIKATFCGEFLPLFRDQRDKVGLDAQSNLRHVTVGRHFKVKFCPGYFAKKVKVSVLDMASVFPEVNDQTICSCQFDQDSGRQRIRIGSSTCLPQGRDVVDIHSKPGHPSSFIQISLIMNA
jgi:hypothetical protein